MTRYHSTLCGCIYDVDADYNWIDQQVEIEGVITSHICDKHLPENNGRKDIRILGLLERNRELLAALKWLDTAIMPEEREYGLYGYCMIHREILREIDGKIKQAIAKAEGE